VPGILDKSFRLYPNPSDDSWQIKVQGSGFKDQISNGRLWLKIYTVAGQEVHSEAIQSSDIPIKIDVRNYEAGMYICTLEVGGIVITSQKAIVE
ncbi:MAG: T9SS type A sorting domain-containing protein, partial [Bacteroidetes bacterium]|nr:T9SS type A sorting domain-containing protein [Bacteroidota bacterium]